MNIFVNIKAAGKRKAVFEKKPYKLSDGISTLGQLITEIVSFEVAQYNRKDTDAQLVDFFTQQELDERAQAGKIGFGRIYSDRKADEATAVENVLQCFEDGLIRIFKEDEELTSLTEKIILNENDTLTFIRLTALAGRLW